MLHFDASLTSARPSRVNLMEQQPPATAATILPIHKMPLIPCYGNDKRPLNDQNLSNEYNTQPAFYYLSGF